MIAAPSSAFRAQPAFSRLRGALIRLLPLLCAAALALSASHALADDDDDDDDDRPRRRVFVPRVPMGFGFPPPPMRYAPPPRAARPAPRPRPPAARPERAGPEFVILMPAGGSPVNLEAEGFVVTSRVHLSSPGRELVRLRGGAREPSDATMRRLQQLVPGGIVDRNVIYRPSRLECSVAECLPFAMVDWPGPPRSCMLETTIGMIDTAVRVGHPALPAGAVEAVTIRSPDRRPSSERHGTSIAALLVGQPDGTHPGLLPRARLVAVDVFHLGPDGRDATDVFDLVRGLDVLMGRGIRIANLSLSGPESPLLREAVSTALAKGMVLVAAAGNEGPRGRPVYPAAYQGVLAVTAIDRDRRVFRQANRGDHIAFAAPGVNIAVADTTGRRGPQSGTSLAVPYVTAAMALALRDGRLDREAAIETLGKNAVDLGAPGKDRETGWGLVRRAGECS